jgi:predicted nucleic acid-binding protein
MRQVFVDTSAWYAIADPVDANHQTALAIRNALARQYHLITTNYVLDELYTLLLLSVGYRLSL